MPDGVPPERIDDLFRLVIRDLDLGGNIYGMRRFDGLVLIALDGSRLFRLRWTRSGKPRARTAIRASTAAVGRSGKELPTSQ